MAKAAVVHEFGGPDAFSIDDIEVGAPGDGQVRIRQTAIGVNFAEVKQRSGDSYNFPLGDLPIILGREGAGIVEAVGAGAEAFKPGDRVAYGMGGTGGYAEERLVAANRLLHLPDGITEATAASVMVRGLTAWYLGQRAYPIQPGDWVLVHAAAGGVGLILIQWAKHVGAVVIGTAGSDAKTEIAASHGCDHVINYTNTDVAGAVADLTGGAGVAAVFDAIGRDTFEASLDSLADLGHFVTYGAASGDVTGIDPKIFMHKGSLHFTRTSLRHYTKKRSDLETGAQALFQLIKDGAIRPKINQFHGLEEMAAAHRALESRQLTGSVVVRTGN
ncbi:MAG: quinone oxidoreductase [Rhodospirillaceae bacterium]|nr:quinone oxidoreductase [Rhodospirillaceae bacterium]MBT3885468.1 quinone oxidoreductase [Rhodospirillaceae bacterium]MBT4117172.1 quinone oxidoreductase [Rhodospirillaceae bacterium]MBT4673242.1 quinone oxidoreductase [Rhodospirillaceae bacterium]MBT4720223.1 quinone oxidoreductase [Rhodospirillaceae bacterium]